MVVAGAVVQAVAVPAAARTAGLGLIMMALTLHLALSPAGAVAIAEANAVFLAHVGAVGSAVAIRYRFFNFGVDFIGLRLGDFAVGHPF